LVGDTSKIVTEDGLMIVPQPFMVVKDWGRLTIEAKWE